MHSYPTKKGSCGLSCFMKSGRTRKDFRFLASTPEEAHQWVSGFADQHCFVNCLPHPLVSSKKQASDLIAGDFPLEPLIKCKSPPRMLVILNPRSGRGRSSKVFHRLVEPIFKVCYKPCFENSCVMYYPFWVLTTQVTMHFSMISHLYALLESRTLSDSIMLLETILLFLRELTSVYLFSFLFLLLEYIIA